MCLQKDKLDPLFGMQIAFSPFYKVLLEKETINYDMGLGEEEEIFPSSKTRRRGRSVKEQNWRKSLRFIQSLFLKVFNPQNKLRYPPRIGMFQKPQDHL